MLGKSRLSFFTYSKYNYIWYSETRHVYSIYTKLSIQNIIEIQKDTITNNFKTNNKRNQHYCYNWYCLTSNKRYFCYIQDENKLNYK